MTLYAELPAVRNRQILGDLALALWIALWLRLSVAVLDATQRLAAPGRDLERAGGALQRSLGDTGARASELPLVGDLLREPLDAASNAAGSVTQAGITQQNAVGRLALILALLVAVLPIAWAIGRHVPARIRWMREYAAARRLQGDVDLLALRAATSLPLHVIGSLGPEPVARWRRGEPGAGQSLAALQLRALGLRQE